MSFNFTLQLPSAVTLEPKKITKTNIGRTDAEAPILWPPNVKNWLTGKDPDAGKD